MSPEVAGHVGVHVSKAVEGAKGEVEEESSHEGEIPPHLFTPHHHHCCADLNPLSEMEIYIL